MYHTAGKIHSFSTHFYTLFSQSTIAKFSLLYVSMYTVPLLSLPPQLCLLNAAQAKSDYFSIELEGGDAFQVKVFVSEYRRSQGC